jgi:translation initiation factor 2 beta subunit (eIF-2beta)/eIF-5
MSRKHGCRGLAPPHLIYTSKNVSCWQNFAYWCDFIKRPQPHVYLFVLSHCACNVWWNRNSNTLTFDCKIHPRKLEQFMKKYIFEYITCPICYSPWTKLLKRYTLRCEECGLVPSRKKVEEILSSVMVSVKARFLILQFL